MSVKRFRKNFLEIFFEKALRMEKTAAPKSAAGNVI
jgi:hypothetical protein